METEKLKISRECALCGLVTEDSVVVCPVDGSALITRKPDPMLGKEVANKFKILSLLGVGGMSNVYKAHHKLLDRFVALKILHAEKLTKNSSVLRFQQEAKAAMTLSHPNIVSVFDFGLTDDNIPYLVMDYVEGKSLDVLLEQTGALPFERCVSIFSQACDALQHAHDHGIVHRDVKPSNIMVLEREGQPDQVKLLDFGIAKLLPRKDTPDRMTLTQTGELFGSPQYMSPEQWAGSELDARSDMYSLGCVMYEALTGRPPVKGDNILETIQKHTHERAAAFKTANPNISVPEYLEAVVLKTLEKDAQLRFPSMAALKRNLEFVPKFAEDEKNAPPAPPSKDHAGEHREGMDKANVLLTAGMITGTILAVGIVGVIMLSDTSLGNVFPQLRLAIQERRFGADSPKLLPMLDQMRDENSKQQRLKEAVDYGKRAVEISQASAPDSIDTAQEKYKLAGLLKLTNDSRTHDYFGDALATFEKVAHNNRTASQWDKNVSGDNAIDATILTLEESVHGPNSADYAKALLQTAIDEQHAHGADRAEPYLEKLAATSSTLSKDENVQLLACEKALAEQFSADGHADKSETHYKQAIDLATKTGGAQTDDVANLQAALGMTYIKYNRYNDAEKSLLDAVGTATGTNNSKLLASFYEDLAQLYREMKEFKKADDFVKLAENTRNGG